MKRYQIHTYNPQKKAAWDTFVSTSKNATFLFYRDYMDYHKDRFEDFSLMIYDNTTLVALIPANRVREVVYSHQGLSYGGILLQDTIRLLDYVSLFKEVMLFFEQEQIRMFQIKLLPRIYHKLLSDEIEYVAFLMKASLWRSDVYLTLDGRQDYNPNRNRKRTLKVASAMAIDVREDDNYDGFWNHILIPNLQERFGVDPVHTATEIKQLATHFPEHIKLFNAYQNDKLKAGVVLFISDNVAHFQYSSGGTDRKDTAALDILFDAVIKKYHTKNYVSFGSSSENNGKTLNEGLAYWKESFGAQTTVQQFIEFDVTHHHQLDALLS
ncbi:GNAT family N-acetyltransferase [Flavobacterium aciduliphilum]|uniref:Acetyltransferase (GNAT) family protein n=1 Tax=Flavobacterium aciduliphilum TaxID=1101402 RepID=A0A328YPP1_9FLAO|nr:GNAT family N-acetyltransferase [Flavobacterium aciduliphilum]RAR75324.1 hypothetical protein CLV55_10119 [Flavobacterium aciduliphilum]